MRNGRSTACVLVVVAAFAAACSSNRTPTGPSAASPMAGSVPPPTSGPPETSPPPAPPPADSPPQTTRYRLIFNATWSASSHPIDFPSNAHFSPLVGGTHDNSVVFWRDGALASPGIQAMAERGRTSPLDQEIEDAARAGRADRAWVGGGLNGSQGMITLDFEISQRYPLATFVTMIAPSPDWFVGVSGVALFENGQWVSERRFDLAPWDAGTDSGVTFTSPDQETRPHAAISRILSPPLGVGGTAAPLGTFTFTRLPG